MSVGAGRRVGNEACRYDPREHGEASAALTEAERARRERMRERAQGVTTYACDRDVTRAVFVDGGQLCPRRAERRLAVDGPDGGRSRTIHGCPRMVRMSRTWSTGRSSSEGATVREGRELASDSDPDVHWGLADFIAAEELDRKRGYWWSPDGSRIAAARVDERPVQIWWISEPSDPAAEPRRIRYPRAGTPNAIVTLHVIDVATAERVEVVWDREAFEYLARVSGDRTNRSPSRSSRAIDGSPRC